MTLTEALAIAAKKFPIQNPNCKMEVSMAMAARKAYAEKLVKGIVKIEKQH